MNVFSVSWWPGSEALALTLLHFLWQGCVITAAGCLVASLLPAQRSFERYYTWVLTFGLLLLAPAVTLWRVAPTGPAVPVAVAQPLERHAPAEWPEDLLTLLANDEELAALLATPASSDGQGLPAIEAAGSAAAESAADNGHWSTLWSQWIVTLWMVGAMLASLRLIAGLAWVGMLVHHLQPVPVDFTEWLARLSTRVGLRHPPRLAVSELVSEPLVLMWWRPIVVLPASWLTSVSPEMVEAVLAHELAHIRRWDLWINLVQRLGETALFFHPCVWWVSRQIRQEREFCCDAEAVQLTGEAVVYAQALELVARQRWARRSVLGMAQPSLVVGLGGTRMAVLERVKQVLGLERSTAEASWWTLGIAGVGLSTACWMGSSLWGNPILAEDKGLFVAQADDDDDDRPRPPRPPRDDDRPDGPPPPRGPRGEGPPDGPRGPRDGGPREGGPRDGGPSEHGPRDEGPRGRGPREEGPHGPGPRDGAPRPPHPPGPQHADHGPGREHGHHEGRPADKLTADLIDAFRKLEHEGPEGKRKQHEILAQLIRAMHHGDHMIPAPPPGGPIIHRFEFATGPDSRPRPDAEPQPRMLPPAEALQDVHHAMRELRREVDRLRDEMAHLRHEAGEGPRHPREGGPHHPGEGGPRHPGPRHRGDAEPPRGRPGRPEEGPRPPRDGDRGPRPPRGEDRAESDTPREEAVPVKPAAEEAAPRDDQTTAEEAPISASTVEADE